MVEEPLIVRAQCSAIGHHQSLLSRASGTATALCVIGRGWGHVPQIHRVKRGDVHAELHGRGAIEQREGAVAEVALAVLALVGRHLGMGEAPVHRAGLIAQLANLQPYPESVPINSLVRVPGTPLADSEPIDPLDFVRVIAVARITMPKARVRLSAGRQQMGEAVQALCFMAGANSIFYGDKLLVTGNPDVDADVQLLTKLGLNGHRTTTTQDDHALVA